MSSRARRQDAGTGDEENAAIRAGMNLSDKEARCPCCEVMDMCDCYIDTYEGCDPESGCTEHGRAV